jgi:hypothetical protein
MDHIPQYSDLEELIAKYELLPNHSNIKIQLLDALSATAMISSSID